MANVKKKYLLLFALAIISLTCFFLLFYMRERTAGDREQMKPFYKEQEDAKSRH